MVSRTSGVIHRCGGSCSSFSASSPEGGPPARATGHRECFHSPCTARYTRAEILVAFDVGAVSSRPPGSQECGGSRRARATCSPSRSTSPPARSLPPPVPRLRDQSRIDPLGKSVRDILDSDTWSTANISQTEHGTNVVRSRDSASPIARSGASVRRPTCHIRASDRSPLRWRLHHRLPGDLFRRVRRRSRVNVAIHWTDDLNISGERSSESGG